MLFHGPSHRLLVTCLALFCHVSCLPVVTEWPNSDVITPSNAAEVKALANKMWDLNQCSPQIQIRVDGKMLNKKSFYCSKKDAMKLAPMLMGEKLPDKAYVWCQTALLYHSLDPSATVFDVETLKLFDGDIILTSGTVDSVLAPFYPTSELRVASEEAARDYQRHKHGGRPKRKATTNKSLLWPNAVVYFNFFNRRTFDEIDQQIISRGISQWEENTCIRFVDLRRRDTRPHVTVFKALTGCSSSVGRVGDGEVQHLFLGIECLTVGTVAHEFGHALGLYHEHTRPDRDRYVTFVERNLEETEYRRQFVKQSWQEAETFGIPYDYSSVLHYHTTAFSRRPDLATIIANDDEMGQVLGQRRRISFFDAKAANWLYCLDRCGGSSLEWSECKNGGYRNPNNCTSCLCPRGLAPPRCEEPTPAEHADCDKQILQASGIAQILSSPGYYDNGFPAGGFCSWLIKTSSPGKQIKVQFTGRFNFDNDYDTCLDFVEIRYKGLPRPGPRFCGTQKPEKTFISHGREMLITLETEPESMGRIGFQLKYIEEYCGGCSADASADEPFCYRTIQYNCSDRAEEGYCYQSENYCCFGYFRQNGRCIHGSQLGLFMKSTKIKESTVSNIPTTTTPSPNDETKTINATKPHVPKVGSTTGGVQPSEIQTFNPTTHTPIPSTDAGIMSTATPVETKHTPSSTSELATTTQQSTEIISTANSTTTESNKGISTVNYTTTDSNKGVSTVNSTTTESTKEIPTVNATTTENNKGVSNVNATTTESSKEVPTVNATTTESTEEIPTVNATTTESNKVVSTVDATTTESSKGISTVNSTTTESSKGISTVNSTTTESENSTEATTATRAFSTTANPLTFRTIVTRKNSYGRITGVSSWGPWGEWTACSATCGLCGSQFRRRECQRFVCYGNKFQYRRCEDTACPKSTYIQKRFCRRRIKNDCHWYDFSCFEGYACYKMVAKPQCCEGFEEGGICKRYQRRTNL